MVSTNLLTLGGAKHDILNYLEVVLKLLFYKFCMKMIDHSCRSDVAHVLKNPDYGSGFMILPLKEKVSTTFVVIKFSSNSTVDVADPPLTPFLGPPGPG